MTVFAAVDLGATSGRVMAGIVSGAPGGQTVELVELHRFANTAITLPAAGGATGEPGVHGGLGEQAARLHWDVLALWHNILTGLRTAVSQYGELAGIGICSWAVDYGLVDARGRLLGNPVNYRDERTLAVIDGAYAALGAGQTYARNGLQHQPFTTAFQLLAEDPEQLQRADKLLLIPDLLSAWLTGKQVAEYTNASTTGLVNAATRQWDTEYLAALGIDPQILPQIVAPGTLIGQLSDEAASLVGAQDPIPVWAVASHDTGSAVVAVPMKHNRSAYISSGTWSLVGVELAEPVLTESSRAANITNEGGVDGTIRYLKNVMGLWVLTETLRTWEQAGQGIELAQALELAQAEEAGRTIVDIDDPTLLPPGDMPTRIAALAQAAGQPIPDTPGRLVRCILDSLAQAYSRAIAQISELAGHPIEVVHIVGGGSLNAELCQLTADACGLPVVAGPAEGTALGNVLIQARAAGVVDGNLGELRKIVARSTQTTTYNPR